MVKIGISIPTHAPDIQPDTPVQFARRAEAAGVHSVWVYDRMVFNVPDPLVTLGALAVATERVLIGTGVLLATLRPPTLLAKMVATIDQLSDGRMILGIGSGSRADDFASVQVPFAARGARLDEVVSILKLVWSGQPVAHKGRFYQTEVGPVGPRPRQQPHPPIWVGGFEEPVLQRAARLADAYLGTSARGPDDFGERWQRIRSYARQAGRDPDTITPAVLVHAALADDRQEAYALAKKYFTHYRGPGGEVTPEMMLGTPNDCLRAAEAYLEAGAQVLLIAPVTADLGHFERLCQEVLPRLQG